MTNQPLHNPQAVAQHRFYADLCALENLQRAFTHLTDNLGELRIDPRTFETLEANGVEIFLQQLSSDLQTRTYHPARVAEREGLLALRDLTVQVALKRLLESAFPPTFPSEPEAEKTIKGLAGHIDRGLCRVYALNLNESLDDGGYQRLVERAGRRIGDPQVIGLLKEILAASSQPELLAPLLADIAYEGIDQILQQAKAFGREDNFLHVQCTRVANELVILADGDPRYDWIVPAVQQRLREELSDLHYDPATVESQTLDLTGLVLYSVKKREIEKNFISLAIMELCPNPRSAIRKSARKWKVAIDFFWNAVTIIHNRTETRWAVVLKPHQRGLSPCSPSNRPKQVRTLQRQAPSAKRQAPSAKRQAPSAKRRFTR